jgi:type IV secretory pathway protease TraF
MRSALGDASGIADYDTVKKRLMGSRYTLSFNNGVNFDMTVVTSDSTTAATVSSLLRGYMLYKKMSATPAEKIAVENTTVDSDGSNVAVHFKANDQQFQSLMHSELFAAVTH